MKTVLVYEDLIYFFLSWPTAWIYKDDHHFWGICPRVDLVGTSLTERQQSARSVLCAKFRVLLHASPLRISLAARCCHKSSEFRICTRVLKALSRLEGKFSWGLRLRYYRGNPSTTSSHSRQFPKLRPEAGNDSEVRNCIFPIENVQIWNSRVYFVNLDWIYIRFILK